VRARLLLFCALFACEATGFDPEYLVNTLRVLAIQADAPVAQPGQAVHLTTLWADPNGAGRPVQWAWGTCVNPGSTQIPDCAAALRTLALGGDSFSATVPTDALDGVTVGEFGVVFAACAGTITLAPNAQNGAPVTCKDASGKVVGREGFVWGGTRITVFPGVTNQNPRIDSVSFDGAPWGPSDLPVLDACAEKHPEDCPASTRHVFSYTATPDSAESYDVGLGPQTEQLVGWFFVTQGSLDAGYASPLTADGGADDAGAPLSPPTFQMTFTPTLADPTQRLHVWLVLRDDRGGLSFTQREAVWR
jgi:hypothetical protein